MPRRSLTTEHLKTWVIEALQELDGAGSVAEVAEVIWRRHENDLRASGATFYTWQYDIRWAAQRLRHEGALERVGRSRNGLWTLSSGSSAG